MVTKLSASKYKYTLDSVSGETSKQVATGGGRELVAILVTGGSADIVISIHDSNNGVGVVNQAIYVGANQGETVSVYLGRVLMNKGIYFQIEQGGSPFNGKATIFYD